MNIPEHLLYSKEHEWLSREDDVVTIGITDFAQHELGDVVFVELPEIGRSLAAEDTFGSLESVKIPLGLLNRSRRYRKPSPRSPAR